MLNCTAISERLIRLDAEKKSFPGIRAVIISQKISLKSRHFGLFNMKSEENVIYNLIFNTLVERKVQIPCLI